MLHSRHKLAGTVSMAAPNGSQFLITTRDDCAALDDKETIFGRVVDGMDVIMKCGEGWVAGSVP